MTWVDFAREEKMLHKYEKLLGLPEDSLVYEMEARKELAYSKSSRDRKVANKGEKKWSQ